MRMRIVMCAVQRHQLWAGLVHPSKMSTQSQPYRIASREAPSKVTKERLAQILQQGIQECGRAARQMCQQSGSREVGQLGGGERIHFFSLSLRFC